jgi:putative peptidoglycan lipid II flippase
LPTLSRLASPAIGQTPDQLEHFMNTLAGGLRLVLILIIPATVALFILARPIVALLFEHGDFTALDTAQTILALRLYLLGLPFAAIDQPLIFAFYARQNTLTPALVGLLGVGFYLAAALLPSLTRPLEMRDLVLANSVQLTGHALVMLWLINRLASLRGRGLGQAIWRAGLAAGVMAGGVWGLTPLLTAWLTSGGLVGEVALVGALSLLGGGIYVTMLALLRAPELRLLLKLGQRFVPRP